MKRNIYISYIHEESKNFKFKMMDRFKGRKYKFSDEVTASTIYNEESLLKLEKSISQMDVTVILISRSILNSTNMMYEIDLSLNSSYSKSTNGIVGVVIPDKGNDYSYMMTKGHKGIWRVDKSTLPRTISSNILNEVEVENKNDLNYDSFISVYKWEDFIKNFDICVNAAYEKANELLDKYQITK